MTLYVAATIATFFVSPFLFEGVLGNPLCWLAFLSLLGALVYFPAAVRSDRMGRAFVASSIAIVAMVTLVGIGLYPRFVPSLTDLEHSLTIANASSTPRTHVTMLVIAAIGMPLVVAYTVFVYRTFKGKVTPDEQGY